MPKHTPVLPISPEVALARHLRVHLETFLQSVLEKPESQAALLLRSAKRATHASRSWGGWR